MAVDRERSPDTQRNSSLRIGNSRKDGMGKKAISERGNDRSDKSIISGEVGRS